MTLPKQLTRKARSMLDTCMLCMDQDGEVIATGSPPSVMHTLRQRTDYTRQSVRKSLRELHELGLILVRYKDKCLRVKVIVAKPVLEGICESCGKPANGTGRWCAHCKQTEGRSDRRWQVAALELHDCGHTPARIAVLLQRPLMVASHDDGRNPNGGAVVPFLLSKGKLGAEWATRLREAMNGAIEEA